jgi:curli biogenesis system outer membrane secretion channel CsgG
VRAPRLAISLALLPLLVAGTACTPTIASQARPALAELNAPLQRIAVLPFAVSPLLRAEDGGAQPRVAAQLVSRYVAEALTARGVEVVAPEDVAAALANADSSRRAGAILAQERGADAVVIGDVTRWEEREGEAYGAMKAAAVGFRVTLQGADGRTLWSAEFDERQQPLGDNVLRAGQYPGGGSRWLTAEELARWGAGEVVKSLPLAASRRR